MYTKGETFKTANAWFQLVLLSTIDWFAHDNRKLLPCEQHFLSPGCLVIKKVSFCDIVFVLQKVCGLDGLRSISYHALIIVLA